MLELEFDSHRSKYKAYLHSPNAKTREYYMCKALLSHANTIHSCLYDMLISSNQITLTNSDAYNFMLYGFCRRSSMLFKSYHNIWSKIPANRQQTLNEDESSSLNGDLNLIYLNIRGCLDNLATCYLYEREHGLLELFRKPLDRNLFNHKLIKQSKNNNFWEKILTHEAWYNELKHRRDPVAHRMPLYIIPRVLIDDDIEKHHALDKEYLENIELMQIEAAIETNDRMQKCGEFMPIFAHAPDESPYWIYPTIPEDIGKLIQIYNIVRDELT